MKFLLPFPPSVNAYWRSPNKGPAKGKLLVSVAGRKFKHAVRAAVIEQLRDIPKPSSAPAAVEIILYPPDYRRRDLDNYNKALLDALTYAGIWEDDSLVKRMAIEWGENVKGGRVEITITAYKKVVDTCTAVG
ncbi:bacteriophage V crossover junction endodeoxyribonuclease [Raoultella terrigena]|uniref:RusA family crossover junction endodeoxyribonuclease n=1 Tax=Raoultella terrigena TaxID=577 RepID=UPI001161D555|nr:RusA family crossover junction endodeoxyribonuclease [Raoultella terrigena]VUC84984.1 bacteriophage V crossover junction endodeoxyribonuclease [Raoultella terrigena]